METEEPIKLTERYKLHRRLQRLLGEAITEFGMIEANDKLLLGLSGGKDSLALLDLLGERMQKSNRFFAVEALHVRMRNIKYESDTSYLEQKAARWGIPFDVVEAGFEPDRDAKRTPCFLCSWNRRKVLFTQAQQRGCNKIALGHHQDDILRTALMNMAFNGSFSTMPAKIAMRKFPVTIVRPLAKMVESDLARWALINEYRPVCKVCPYDKESNRTNVLAVTDALGGLNPDYRRSLWHALFKSGALEE